MFRLCPKHRKERMEMRGSITSILAAAVFATGMAVGSSAKAALLIPGGPYPANLSPVNLAGTIAGAALSATATLTVNNFSATQLVLAVTLQNTTPVATPGTNRLISFGFDLVPADNRSITSVASGNADWGVSWNNVNITNGVSVESARGTATTAPAAATRASARG
jgi:hypothetical protein